MADIKTRDPVRGAIKTIDRTTVALDHGRAVLLKMKDQAGQGDCAREGSAVEYASDTVTCVSERMADSSVRQFCKQGQKVGRITRESFTASDTGGMVKVRGKGIKTARAASKAAARTTGQTAREVKAAAKNSAKAAQRAARRARMDAEASVRTVKTGMKAAGEAVKAVIAAAKALAAAIAAGGWIAVAVIVLICLIALVSGSCFGIFFSSGEGGSGQTMEMAVREINADYDRQLQEKKDAVDYDVLEMSGSRAAWKEVLAVYAIKTNTDQDHPQEVVSMDDGKKQLLKEIFWEMNEIHSQVESKTETQVTESDDGHGNLVQTEDTVTRTYLYITVNHKTAGEMADKYAFHKEQRELLDELLAEENNPFWMMVLYGISTGDGEIVEVALSQVGNVGGEPYWRWYGFDSHVEWCACWVSWCANECGYIESGLLPKFSLCTDGEAWFRARGQWQDGGYEPAAGQIIFFDWEKDGKTDHVGIVEKYENGIVYTVEGNAGDACRQRSYPVGSSSIYGYGVLCD